MVDGLDKVGKVKETDRTGRADAWYSGKMTHRHVPAVSRSIGSANLKPGSHIVSDIGQVPVKDLDGNRYWVMLKDVCTQCVDVYRMKKKDELVSAWQSYIASNSVRDVQGIVRLRTEYLVTDDDVMYVKGRVADVNNKLFIGNWRIAPYTHNANPAESEMRRVLEGALVLLHDSGLPPSFMLDALCCYAEVKNRVYTTVCHDPKHEFMTPFQRLRGYKPHINDIARFGCKTHVLAVKDKKLVKGDSHAWIGFYLGPSRQMKASRVLRPMPVHRVYDRYHVLHDSKVMFGDFMGDTYRMRVDADRKQREFYNAEVKALLGNKSETAIVELMRAVPWTEQRLPERAAVDAIVQQRQQQQHTTSSSTAPTHAQNMTSTPAQAPTLAAATNAPLTPAPTPALTPVQAQITPGAGDGKVWQRLAQPLSVKRRLAPYMSGEGGTDEAACFMAQMYPVQDVGDGIDIDVEMQGLIATYVEYLQVTHDLSENRRGVRV